MRNRFFLNFSSNIFEESESESEDSENELSEKEFIENESVRITIIYDSRGEFDIKDDKNIGDKETK